MPSRIVQSCVRGLQRLALLTVLAQPALLPAQAPRVTSARLTSRVSDNGVAADSGYMLLIVRIGGLLGQRLRALTSSDVVITDSQKRAYMPEGLAIGAGDRDDSVDRVWLYRVPVAQTAFELRLRDFAPVSFIATYSPAP